MSPQAALTHSDVATFPWDDLQTIAHHPLAEYVGSHLARWLEPDSPLSQPHRELARHLVPLLFLRPSPTSSKTTPYLPEHALQSLNVGELRNLLGVSDAIPMPDIRAHVVSVAWAKRVRDHKRALTAVSDLAFLGITLFQRDEWSRAFSRIDYAVRLAKSLGKGPQIDYALAAAWHVLDAASHRANYAAHRLIDLLMEESPAHWARLDAVASTLADLARNEYAQHGLCGGTPHEAEHRFLTQRLKLNAKLDLHAALPAIHLRMADGFVTRSDQVLAANDPQRESIAAHFLRSALTHLRQGKAAPSQISSTELKIEQLQRSAMNALPSFSLSVDVGDTPRAARNLVSGKAAMHAVITVAFHLHEPPALAELHESMRERLRAAPFYSLIPASYVGPRGNSVVQHPGVGANSDDYGFVAETIRLAAERQAFVAQSAIAPACHQVAVEHSPTDGDMESMLAHSTFVPRSRGRSVARGLSAGFHQDFDLAAALLFPQLEHCLRELCFTDGKATRNFTDDGSENEWDTNRILSIENLFAPASLYDLRVLLVEKAGWNLRNKLAHGLVDDHGDYAAKIYLWWWFLRLALDPTTAGFQGDQPVTQEPSPPTDAQ